MAIPAIVTAGDRGAAKQVRGESKPYLEVAGTPMVAHVVAVLQRVPEVSEVWVVGDAERLEAVLDREPLRSRLRKPLTIVPQFRSLFENCWETWRRTLPGAGPAGRDPGPDDEHHAALFLSADLPFATPEEISAFVRRALESGLDYAVGLSPESALRDFEPEKPGEPGIRVAYFCLREGRYRQSNLHFAKVARFRNRHLIQEMYENRYQRELGPILKLATKLLRSEGGGLRVIFYYGLLHLAGVVDRRGWRSLADAIRRAIPRATIEQGVSALLATDFGFVFTEAGGCALDVDNEPDYAVVLARYEDWWAAQQEKASVLYGRLGLPAPSGRASLRVLSDSVEKPS